MKAFPNPTGTLRVDELATVPKLKRHSKNRTTEIA